MKTFADLVLEVVDRYHCCIVAGIDPPLTFPASFLENERQQREPQNFLAAYSKAVLEGAAGVTGFVKFQSAFFEARGTEGFAALEESIQLAREMGFFIILDAKRGDIASTMAAYGYWAFEHLKVDALTVSPWMGNDVFEALLPWLKKGSGIYSVWQGSNATSDQVFGVRGEGGACMAQLSLETWMRFLKEHSCAHALGVVVGCNRVYSAAPLLEKFGGKIPVLMPGLGAQGGAVDGAVREFIAKNRGTIANVSRGLFGGGEDDSRRSVDFSSWEDVAQLVRKCLGGFRDQLI